MDTLGQNQFRTLNVLIYQELTQDQAHCNHLSSQCDVQVIITETSERDVDKLEYQKPAYVAVGLIMAITTLTVFFPMMLVAISAGSLSNKPGSCASSCRGILYTSAKEAPWKPQSNLDVLLEGCSYTGSAFRAIYTDRK
ncbi:hypothetical protein CAPTEDRAFT_193610 [Capitella teleta]|uniref:Uncharacterized protein n=1 Tax=Capitella teleta TaxID=283909 RepID=R7VBL1_CAPTE|nr:hypothetical protein CAPTEDRAFT_193610 [Capitella teleta]|eukprot:ELU15957.1 hypothetical protein CAPTEDRAFT_193610 [Capitella teleta]